MSQPERSLPIPKLSAELEAILTEVYKIHVGDPTCFFYGEPLPATYEYNAWRRVVHYLVAFAVSPEAGRALLLRDVKKAAEIHAAWKASIPKPEEIKGRIDTATRSNKKALGDELLKDIEL